MPEVETKNFGKVPYEPAAEIQFPGGLPAFEEHRTFVLIQLRKTHPLLFLQSLQDPGVCFPALRALAVDPLYRLRLTKEDLRRLDLPISRQPRLGEDIECLVVVALREGGATANLLAPVVINFRKMRAIQAVSEEPYSLQHPLKKPGKAGAC
jgi:flagellar assembly factor FliW